MTNAIFPAFEEHVLEQDIFSQFGTRHKSAVPGVVDGTENADVIDTTFTDADGDTVDGADGIDDVIDAKGGDDVINAGDGDDTIIGGAGADSIDGGDGVDFIDFSGSASRVKISLIGGNGSLGDAAGDTYSNIEGVIGTAFGDVFDGLNKQGSTIFAGDGNDTFITRGGNVAFYGEGGNDLFRVDEGRSHDNAIFDGGEGIDKLVFYGTEKGQNFRDDVFTSIEIFNTDSSVYEFNADQVADFQTVNGNGTLDIDLNGAAQIDLSAITFSGTSASTILRGSEADESFVGSAVDDTILAGAGADRLDGGTGTNTLTGGADADVFVFTATSGTTEITDFTQGADKIDLSAFLGPYGELQVFDGATGAMIDASGGRRNGSSETLSATLEEITAEDGTALGTLLTFANDFGFSLRPPSDPASFSITLSGFTGELSFDDFIL